MPAAHEHRGEIMLSLTLGLATRNSEMVAQGIMNKDNAADALLLVNRSFANDTEFLDKTKSSEALRALTLLVSAESHLGKSPLSPAQWGQFLEYTCRSNK